MNADSLLVVLVLATVGALVPGAAGACPCEPMPAVREHVKTVDLAFWGTVVGADAADGKLLATVTPKKVFRGQAGDVVRVESPIPCGVPLVAGRSYTLLARAGSEGVFVVDGCGYSREDPFEPADVGTPGVRDLTLERERLTEPLRATLLGAITACAFHGDVTATAFVYPGGFVELVDVRNAGRRHRPTFQGDCFRSAFYDNLVIPPPEYAVMAHLRWAEGVATIALSDAWTRRAPADAIRARLESPPRLWSDTASKLAALSLAEGVRKHKAAVHICLTEGHRAGSKHLEGFTTRLAKKLEIHAQRELLDCALRKDDVVGALASIDALRKLGERDDEPLLPVLRHRADQPTDGAASADVFAGDDAARMALLVWASGRTRWVDAPIVLQGVARALSVQPDGTTARSVAAVLAFERAALLRPDFAWRYRGLARDVMPEDSAVAARAVGQLSSAFEAAQKQIDRDEAAAVPAYAKLLARQAQEVDDQLRAVEAAEAPPEPREIAVAAAVDDEEESSPWCFLIGVVGAVYLLVAFRRRLSRPA